MRRPAKAEDVGSIPTNNHPMIPAAAGIGRSVIHDAAGIGRSMIHHAAGIARSTIHHAAGNGRIADHDAAGIGRSMIHHAAGGPRPTPDEPPHGSGNLWGFATSRGIDGRRIAALWRSVRVIAR